MTDSLADLASSTADKSDAPKCAFELENPPTIISATEKWEEAQKETKDHSIGPNSGCTLLLDSPKRINNEGLGPISDVGLADQPESKFFPKDFSDITVSIPSQHNISPVKSEEIDAVNATRDLSESSIIKDDLTHNEKLGMSNLLPVFPEKGNVSNKDKLFVGEPQGNLSDFERIPNADEKETGDTQIEPVGISYAWHNEDVKVISLSRIASKVDNTSENKDYDVQTLSFNKISDDKSIKNDDEMYLKDNEVEDIDKCLIGMTNDSVQSFRKGDDKIIPGLENGKYDSVLSCDGKVLEINELKVDNCQESFASDNACKEKSNESLEAISVESDYRNYPKNQEATKNFAKDFQREVEENENGRHNTILNLEPIGRQGHSHVMKDYWDGADKEKIATGSLVQRWIKWNPQEDLINPNANVLIMTEDTDMRPCSALPELDGEPITFSPLEQDNESFGYEIETDQNNSLLAKEISVDSLAEREHHSEEELNESKTNEIITDKPADTDEITPLLMPRQTLFGTDEETMRVLPIFPIDVPKNASPLPEMKQISECGDALACISLKRMITKSWRKIYWVRFGQTSLYIFRSKEDFDDWLLNPYHTQKQRDFLVKLHVDFSQDGTKRGGSREYKQSDVKRKNYDKNKPPLYQFKLERSTDLGIHNSVAFASTTEDEIMKLRQSINRCLRNDPNNYSQTIDNSMEKA